MSNALIFRMRADSGGFKKDLEAAGELARLEGKKMVDSTKGRVAANEGLLESEKRVENKIVGLAGKIANSTGPGIVFAPRRASYPTAALYRRALARWLYGFQYQEAIQRHVRRIRRACGPCEP